jgi:hypothetical protein
MERQRCSMVAVYISSFRVAVLLAAVDSAEPVAGAAGRVLLLSGHAVSGAGIF